MASAKSITIGVDLMGAEINPAYIVHAVMELPHAFFKHTSIHFFATSEICKQLAEAYDEEVKTLPISFRPCKDIVSMDDDPLSAIRKKKETTMSCGIQSLKAKSKKSKIDAFLSCGNSGALVASSILHLKLLPGIDRPALITTLCVNDTSTVLLDVGALVHCKLENLVQFAYMGAAFVQVVKNKKKPTIAQLNIGAEYGKGMQEQQAVNKALTAISQKRNAPFSYIGNIEPQGVFEGVSDIVVTNGFAGNIMLKTAESAVHSLMEAIEKRFVEGQNPDDHFPFSELKASFSQDSATGACLLGVNGYVVKCHGQATISAVQQALLSIRLHLQNDLIGKVSTFLTKHLPL